MQLVYHQHELGLKYHCLEIGWEMAPIFRGKEHMIIIILIYAHKIPRSMQKMQRQASKRHGLAQRDAVARTPAAHSQHQPYLCAEVYS